jgi:murein DD-endopeptidase MepM/ murein hydrolase activator NlpD
MVSSDMARARALLTLCAIIALASSPALRPAQAQLDFFIELFVPAPPTPVKGDGKLHLAYELHITNFNQAEVMLEQVEVLGDDDNPTPLAHTEGTDLSGRLARPGAPRDIPERRRIGNGLRAVVFMWITLDADRKVPETLRHRLTFATSGADNSKSERRMEGGLIRVRSGKPLVIAPPLRGGEWLAGNGPANNSGHRRALVPIGGKACIAQRFAIDWVQLREDGKTWAGDRLKNASYRAYGAEILAVADASVVSIKDGIPENIPGPASRAVPITLETVGGNYVILDLGNDRYAFYAHMQPGSIRVKPGDRVRRGQVLGLLGNSGNSTEPHLHFHIGDSNSPLGSEGLPYVFESFEVQGHGWGWKPTGPNPTVEKRSMEIPLQNAVVRFPGVS